MLKLLRTISVSALLLLATGAIAQEGEAEEDAGPKDQVEITGNPEREVKVQGLSERTYNSLTKVHERIGEEMYEEAFSAATVLLGRVRSNAYESANVLQTMAHIKSATEEYPEAITFFEEAVALNSLPNRAHFDMMFTIAQLYMLLEQYERGLQALDAWAAVVDEIKPAAYIVRASAHSALENYRPALEAIKKAIAMSVEPKESWYNLQLAMHFELKELPEAADTLEILVRIAPNKKNYWMQLHSILFTLKRDQEALAVLALAHRKGLLDKEMDYKQLFNIYGYMKIPYKSAQVMQEGLDKGIVEPTKENWESLANAYYGAQELDQAIVAFQKAAEQALDGKVDQQIAFIESERENWENVRTSAANAIEKGGLKDSDVGNMYLLWGMAEFELGDMNQAKTAFEGAQGYDEVRSAAVEWLNHIREEAKRVERNRQVASTSS